MPSGMRHVLLAALLMVACNTRQRVAGAGAGMAVVGLALTYSNDTRAADDVGTRGTVGITLLLTGLGVLFVAAALDEVAAKEAAARPPPRVKREVSISPEQAAANRVLRRRTEAWELTKQAQAAARDGDCARVTELSAKVGSVDAEFYADVFMTDVAIQRCFVANHRPAEAPSLPPPIPVTLPPPTSTP